jgi:hypothetical protein
LAAAMAAAACGVSCAAGCTAEGVGMEEVEKFDGAAGRGGCCCWW